MLTPIKGDLVCSCMYQNASNNAFIVDIAHRFPHCVVFVSGCLERHGRTETDLRWVGFHLSLLDLGRTQRKRRNNQKKTILLVKMHVFSGCERSVHVAVVNQMEMASQILRSQALMTWKKRTRKMARSLWLGAVRFLVTGVLESSQTCYLWNKINYQPHDRVHSLISMFSQNSFSQCDQ